MIRWIALLLLANVANAAEPQFVVTARKRVAAAEKAKLGILQNGIRAAAEHWFQTIPATDPAVIMRRGRRYAILEGDDLPSRSVAVGETGNLYRLTERGDVRKVPWNEIRTLVGRMYTPWGILQALEEQADVPTSKADEYHRQRMRTIDAHMDLEYRLGLAERLAGLMDWEQDRVDRLSETQMQAIEGSLGRAILSNLTVTRDEQIFYMEDNGHISRSSEFAYDGFSLGMPNRVLIVEKNGRIDRYHHDYPTVQSSPLGRRFYVRRGEDVPLAELPKWTRAAIAGWLSKIVAE